jgi:carbon monoxide dehydrogenase subunit G
MTIAIRIGAGSTAYDNLNGAYAAAIASKQKLSITGTGEEIKAELSKMLTDPGQNQTQFDLMSKSIGSIKATNDLNLDTTEVANYKAALVKLGSKSIVLASSTTSTNLAAQFNDLDAVYTKVKSITLLDANTATPTIAVGKLATAINMGGLEILTGKKFNVSGRASDIKANMDSLLKNISKIDKIVVNASTATIGSTTNVAFNSVVTSNSHGFTTGEEIRYDGPTDPGNITSGSSYYARRLTANTFQVFGSYAEAVNVNASTGRKDVVAATGTFTSKAGVEFTTKQLSILGDKLVKADDSTVVLKDTADNLLATSSIALINKLNNTNINTAAVTATVSSVANTNEITSTAGHGFRTGDKVHVTASTPAAGVLNNADYYVKVINGTKFQLFDSYNNAITGTSAKTATSLVGSITSVVGPNPFRTTLLDEVKVTEASLDQAKRFVALSKVDPSITGSGAGTRLMSNIVRSIEIADTVTNLNAANDTKLITGGGTISFDAAKAAIIDLGTAHNLKTGDAFTYSVDTGKVSLTGLTSGTTYFIGETGHANKFYIFTTQKEALAADLTDDTTAAAGGAKVIAARGNALDGEQKFTVSALDQTMSDVARLKNNNSGVGRVTIKGSGAITSIMLSDIATRGLRGNPNGQVTYSAKAVDIQNNIQDLYENQTAALAGNGTAITEIVVNDGTSKGKKALTLTDQYFQTLRDVFKEGVDKHTSPVPVTPKNYTFNVTAAAYGRLSTLQNEMDVGAFAVVGATAAQLKVSSISLGTDLGYSKLKTMTSVGVDNVDRNIIQGLLSAVGSGPDRAKLKLVSQL